MRRILAALLVFVVILAFAGCGRSKEDKTAESVPVTTTASVVTTPQPMSAPDVAEYVQARTVTVTAESGSSTGTGSGFFVDDQGTIVTCYHVIDGADKISVEITGGGKYDVQTIIDCNELNDVAVLKVDISGNDYLEKAGSAARTGETVYAVGSSLGFLDGTFSSGIISSTSRSIGTIRCLQTTAAISGGNSGGPLVNEFGEVVGINAFTYSSGDSLHLAINIDVLDQLPMDKNWSISQFREWYNKEIGRSYLFYNYTEKGYEYSKVHTYQFVTGEECVFSDQDWDFLSGESNTVVEGYDEDKGVYCYLYDVGEFDSYTEYLGTMGFTFLEKKDFPGSNGVSYYYENEFSGQKMDLFVCTIGSVEVICIEPYIP